MRSQVKKSLSFQKKQIVSKILIILVTTKELKWIYKRFAKLDKFNRGYVTIHDLATIPEVDKNPLGDRICWVLAEEDSHTIDFKKFVRALAAFNQWDNYEEKLECKPDLL